jgi:hypothetical protein
MSILQTPALQLLDPSDGPSAEILPRITFIGYILFLCGPEAIFWITSPTGAKKKNIENNQTVTV